MKLAKSLIVIALSTSLISGCSIDESLSSLGSASISEITDEIINQTLDIAGAISNDSTEQDYINSEMKGAVDDLMGIIEKSYETYDYVVDTSSYEMLYSDENNGLAVYTDNSAKVFLVEYKLNKTVVFSGDAATEFLNSYIEKASGIDLNNY